MSLHKLCIGIGMTWTLFLLLGKESRGGEGRGGEGRRDGRERREEGSGKREGRRERRRGGKGGEPGEVIIQS